MSISHPMINRSAMSVLALMGLSAGVPAHAISVTASAEYLLDGITTELATSSSELTALAFVTNTSALSRFDGVLNVSAGGGGIFLASFGFPPPAGAESYRAVATWETSITNNSSSPVAYSFLFNVENPRLGTSGNPGDFAGLGIDILLDGNSIWTGQARIDGCSLSFENMGGTPDQFDCDAFFPSFDAGVSLGSFAPGQSFTLSYVMTAFVDSALVNSSSYAAIGDPFFPQGSGATIVPLPAAFGFYAFALAGIALMRRLRR